MKSIWRCAILAQLILPHTALGQLADRNPPPPPPPPPSGAELSLLAEWIERWLPTVAAVSASALDSTGDFYGRMSDSVLTARLDGCTLVLQERSVSIVRGWRSATYRSIYVPLAQVDTALVQPKLRRARLLLNQPTVLLTGQLVVPLRNRARIEFITVFAGDEDPRYPMLVSEYLLPLVFAEVPAQRSALALREAAARCGAT
jgi:hypothetical protein